MNLEPQLTRRIAAEREHLAALDEDLRTAKFRITGDDKADAGVHAAIDQIEAEHAQTSKRIARLEERVALAQQAQTDEARAAATKRAAETQAAAMKGAEQHAKLAAQVQQTALACFEAIVRLDENRRATLAAVRDAGADQKTYNAVRDALAMSTIDYGLRVMLTHAGLADVLHNYLAMAPVSNVGDADVESIASRGAARATAWLKHAFGKGA